MLIVEVETARVERAVSALLDGLETELDESWAQIGARAVEAATPLVPFLSGELVASLQAVEDEGGIDVESDVVYAAVQNYGWPARNIEGTEFLAAAERVMQDDSADVLASGIQALIRRVGLD